MQRNYALKLLLVHLGDIRSVHIRNVIDQTSSRPAFDLRPILLALLTFHPFLLRN